MNPVALMSAVGRTYGTKGLVRRGVHEARRRAGRFLKAPATGVVRLPLPRALVSYRPRGNWQGVPDDRIEAALVRGRKVLDGWYEAFGHDWRRMPADASAWRTHFATGYEFPAGKWWRVPLLPPQADVKDVWEPARFGWVFDLVRAYSVSGDRAYADAFHRRLAAWMDANPPFAGVHWACGQETSIRALAIIVADDGLPLPEDGPRGAAERIANVLAWSGERIADAIGYGLSQRNNHGISEAAGLVQIGLRLGAGHPDSARWVADGVAYLNEQILDQFADDGWYAQHSFVYSRLALEQALLAQNALQSQGKSLAPRALAALDAGLSLVMLLVDGETGALPNHGANDGSRVAPLSVTSHGDFRPLLTLGALLRKLELPEDVAADPEVVNWLGMGEPRRGAPRVDGVWSGSSGWAFARVGGACVFLRAAHYTHRPSHIDPLHTDVRFGSQQVVTDAGTYAYNAPPPWRNALASGVLHNGPVVDDREAAARGPRFLWYSWPSAHVVSAGVRGGDAWLIAERPGCVRREVRVSPDAVEVVDAVLARAATTVQVTWLLDPSVQSRSCVAADEASVIEAGEGDPTGWFSPTYGLRVPSRAVRVRRTLAAGRPEIRTVIRSPRLADRAE